MMLAGPEGAPWELEIEVYEKADLNCIDEIDTEKIQGLFLNFHAKYSLRFLKKFSDLKYLMIGGAVSDLSPIMQCHSLEELYLAAIMIDDLSVLSDLPIKRLTLEYIRSKQPCLEFPLMPQLEELVLAGAPKLSELDFLKRVPALETLRLYRQKTKELPDFSSLPNLHTLHLNECKHLKGYEKLRTAQSLQHLSVVNMTMNSDDLAAISQMMRLKKLLLSEITYKAKDNIQLSDALKNLGLESKMK